MDRHEDTVRSFRERGRLAALAHQQVRTAFETGLRDQDPTAYSALLTAFFEATAKALEGVDGPLERIDDGDGGAIDHAIAFLAADPWFFRSGYRKAALIRRLKRCPLDDVHRERLRGVILAIVASRDRREFRSYCHLAIAVTSPQFVTSLRVKALDPDPGVRRRAGWVLARVAPASLRRAPKSTR